MSAHPTRRRFVRMAAAGLVAVPLMSACGDPEPMIPEPMIPEPIIPETAFDHADLVRAYFGDDGVADARAVGAHYNRRFEVELDAELELAALLTPIAEQSDMATIIAQLEATLADDFDDARMASVAGWQLGLTEARLCGLADWLAQEPPCAEC